MDQTHLRLEPAGQLLQCLLNNPFFILLQCKLYFLIAGIFKAAAATEIKHLISEGIMGLGKKTDKGKYSTLLLAMEKGELGDALHHLTKGGSDFCLKCMLPAPVDPP